MAGDLAIPEALASLADHLAAAVAATAADTQVAMAILGTTDLHQAVLAALAVLAFLHLLLLLGHLQASAVL